MKVFGIDFTSRPSRRKPITCAICELEGDVLTFIALETFATFAPFEDFLSTGGPWIAGLDFPFGQAQRFVETIGWPAPWPDYVRYAGSLGRTGFRSALDGYRAGRDLGDKEHRRRFDVLAGSISPQKLYGVPVGLMFFEGAQRLLSSGVSVPGLLPGDPSRVVFEAYPGIAARSLVGRFSYKNDQTRKQTTEHAKVRQAIHRALLETGRRIYDMDIVAPLALTDDPSGDRLDALLCAVQAAWAWRNLDACLEKTGQSSTEGWIADPALFKHF